MDTLNLSRALRFFSPSNRFVRRLIMLPAKPVPLALCRVVTWSLGGIYVRKLGQALSRTGTTGHHPCDTIRGQAGFDPCRMAFCHLNGGVSPMDEALLERLSMDPGVPCTSVYSQTDGIVAWQGCVGTESAHHRNIEVAGVSHLGMVHHPEVLRIVAGLLAHSFC